MILIALLIVLLLIIRDKEEKNRKESEEKKKNIIGYDIRTGIPLYKGEKVIGYNTQTGQPIIKGREIPEKVEKQVDKSKISNSILMIVGAGLIVFATIVFLTSSWDSIPNIIKPFILIFIQIIFFASHLICEKKLDIPKTGKVFKFLSFMFIPIVLISFSCFELIGESLSINGEYAYIYFTISLLISDIIFKVYDKFYPDMVIKRTSIFIEAAAVICFTEFFKTNCYGMIFFAIYASIIYVLLHYNIMDKKAYRIPNLIIIGLSMFCFAMMAGPEQEFLYYLPFAIYTILFFMLYIIEKEEQTQKLNLYFFIVNYLAFFSAIQLLTIPSQSIYLLCLIPFTVLAKKTKSQSLREILIWVVFGLTTVNVISTINHANQYYDLLALVIASGLYGALFTITDKLRPVFKCAIYITIAIFFSELCNCLGLKEVQKYVCLLVALIIYLLEEAFPKLKDSTSEHLVPLALCLESIILGLATLGDESLYTVIIPLILIIIYSRLKKVEEGYVLIPTLASLSLFLKDPNPISVGVCSSLVLIYSLLSAFKKRINMYTLVSLLSIIIGLPFLKADVYIVFLTLGTWGIVHLIANEEHKELFKLSIVASILGIYLKGIYDLDVSYISIYFLGLYLALIATTKLVFQKETKELPILESISFIILTLISLLIINEPVDAILMIIILFVITLFSFINKYKVLLYCSLAGMIIHIIKQTLEFWTSIPIYIYVLIIGLTLILFAMFDERLNINKKDKEKTSKKDNIE